MNPSPTLPAMPKYLRQERDMRDGEAQDRISGYSTYLTEAEWASLSANALRSRGFTLEAGCGTGRFLGRLVAGGYEVVGVELSNKSLCVVRQSPDTADVPLCQAELTALPFASAAFDTIYCIGVFQAFLEIRDAEYALRELVRVLKDNGELLLTTWNYQLCDRIRRARIRRQVNGFNFRRFDSSELTALLDKVLPNAQLKVWTGVHFHRKPLKLGDRLLPS